jgi:hypothetical protein
LANRFIYIPLLSFKDAVRKQILILVLEIGCCIHFTLPNLIAMLTLKRIPNRQEGYSQIAEIDAVRECESILALIQISDPPVSSAVNEAKASK